MGASPPDAGVLPTRRGRRRARAHPRRVRADLSTSSAARPTRSSSRCSRCCGASTAPTSTRRSCCARCRPRAATCVMGPGENAGAVDVGGGLACAFKVESHNHPSAVEPFQGAATGVGGILRDIFAIGARPIAVLDSLRFGEPETSERSRYLLDRAVAGIGHYGNSIGVPTIGGEVYFEAPYEQNCLVNAMALGLGAKDRLMTQRGRGRRQRARPVRRLDGPRRHRRRVGARQSAELGEADEDKRPTVQVGDPFAEKKLMECSLELLDRGLLVSLQDLGAAGLTSSASEMASKGEVGLDLDVARVPLREADMEPFEIMVSESQERMLCVCEPARLDEVLAVCATLGGPRHRDRRGHRHRAHAGVRRRRARRRHAGRGARRRLPALRPRARAPRRAALPDAPPPLLAPGVEPAEALLALLRSPNIASRLPLFEQYDWIVQSRTVRRPEEADAAVLLLPDGIGARRLDRRQRPPRRRRPVPRHVEVVLECAANLACVGAEPLGVTNNLNFGNPEKPHVAWQLTEAVRGLGDACRALERAGRRRQRLALQRGRGGPDLPDAGRRHGRPPARRAPRRTARVRAAGRRGRARRRVPPVARRGRAGQAVRRAAARRPARRRRRRGPRGASRPSATRCARAR